MKAAPPRPAANAARPPGAAGRCGGIATSAMSKKPAAIERPELGLVCMSADDSVRFRTITRTHLRKFPEAEQQRLLRALYQDNLARLHAAVTLCQALHIRLYRMPSNLFPFSDAEIGAPLLQELAELLRALGERAQEQGLRLVMHPDQFVVLSSDNPAVVQNSREILQQHGELMDLLGLPRTPYAAINIHGGKAGREAALCQAIRALPDAARLRLTLENDERAYGSAAIYAVCVEAGVPMVFDAHHHVIHEALASYDDPDVGRWLAQARGTWSDGAWQLTHISNGRAGFDDMAHSDFISAMPQSFKAAPWIEVEAKAKDQAIRRLRQELGW